MGGPYTVRVWPFRQNGHGNKAALHAEFFMTSGNISFHCAVNNTGCQPATTGWKGIRDAILGYSKTNQWPDPLSNDTSPSDTCGEAQ
jgi:hypothetical protein